MADESSQDPSGAPDKSAGGDNQDTTENTENKNSQAGGSEDKVAYSTYSKVLSELKSIKDRYRQTEEKAKQLEAEKLEAEGNKDELIKRYKDQLAEEQKKANQLQANYAFKTVSSKVQNEAAKRGCVDPEALVNLCDLASLEVDENFNVDDDAMSALIEETKKKRPYLFRKSGPAPADGTPGVQTGGKKKLSDIPLKERIKMLAESEREKKH